MTMMNSVYHLIDGVLDEGLPYIADYVEKNLRHPLVITDQTGRIHYPMESGCSPVVDDAFYPLPAEIAGRDYYYQPGPGHLHYRVLHNDHSAYIIAQGVPVEQISQALSVLMETRLAVKCYFTKLRQGSEHFENELAEYLFYNSNADIRDIARQSEKRLETDRTYYVTLIEAEETVVETSMQMVRSYLFEYFKKEKFETVPITWSNTLAMIIPARSNGDGAVETLSWPTMISCQTALEKKFGLSLSQGIGQVYPLDKLRKSFYEARIALTLPRLLGKDHYVQKFPDLGIYYPIFRQNLKNIKSFCRETLGRVIEYDEKTEGELMPTLRKLLDSNVNMKSTADSLFIHVNTLYYRVSKIEELLGIDFSSMDSRVNLFIAVKVWDTLQATNLVQTDDKSESLRC
ncbi:MAG: hypothetical protein GXY50_10320 [Syntrophomonadaceae bacterium]|nr:hypothetical protein [Syntrophomonadaceae bacterium]